MALRYAEGDSAPVVVAKGRGALAEEIIRRARDAGLFVHESRELVSLLLQVDLDQRIPPELYLAIAELLSWVYLVEQRSASAGAAHASDALPRSLALPTGRPA